MGVIICIKPDLEGPVLPIGTHYYMISVEDPKLFAVDVNDANVSYYYDGKWHRYVTACIILV